jgi:endonuclease/exonuclease/phosphatase family metal-dependent hydrolase
MILLHNEPVTKLIDYIFYFQKNLFKEIKISRLERLTLRYPSDHLPVYVEIAFK